MKRTYEERVQLTKHAHKHTGHKPSRIDIGLHKTKRHAFNDLQEHLVVDELFEEFEQEKDSKVLEEA